MMMNMMETANHYMASLGVDKIVGQGILFQHYHFTGLGKLIRDHLV